MIKEGQSQAELSPELAGKNKEKLFQIFKLASSYLHNSLGDIVLSHGEDGHENFSGDGASLYTLAVDESGKTLLAKIGWGEFSKTAFTKDYPKTEDKHNLDWNQRIEQERGQAVKRLKNLPIEMFVVPQTESYLANEKIKSLMDGNPEQYLRNYSTLVLDNGNLTYSKSRGISSRGQIFDGEVKAKSFSELAADFKNCIIEADYNAEDFADKLRGLPDDPKAAFEYLTANPDFFNIIGRLDINHTGIAIGHEDSMNSIIQLKNRFDFKAKRFIS